MKIYYKDRDVVVCEKPYGVSSQLSNKENMISILENELGCTVFPIHRLDTTTTGLIVYALNKKSASLLSDCVAKGYLNKEYYAVVHGKLATQGRLIDFLYHDRIRNKSFVAKSERGGTKKAELEYLITDSVQLNGEELSLVRIKLFTGRTHQIRVQMANAGGPLFGDGKYGAKDNGKIRLHSAYISFPHPKSGELMEFSSIPSGEIWELFKISEQTT